MVQGFAFGGSTTLVLFQPGAITFDADLLKNSNMQLETLVKVGTSSSCPALVQEVLGKFISTSGAQPSARSGRVSL